MIQKRITSAIKLIGSGIVSLAIGIVKIVKSIAAVSIKETFFIIMPIRIRITAIREIAKQQGETI
jgi:hypothetical protein